MTHRDSTCLLCGHTSNDVSVGLIAWIAAALGLMRGARAVTRSRLLGVDASPG